MKFKKGILLLSTTLILGLTSNNCAFSSKLPEDVWKYVKNSLPQAQQRFDSVLTISDNIMYIPLYPPTNTTVDEIKIEYTYPQNQNLSQLPEVILFNNGYSLLRVTKDKEGNYSLTKKDDLPIKVRLGLMPQDMLTPIGLKMPESLKLTLGDLLIPSKSEACLGIDENEKNKSIFNPTVKRNEFIAANYLQNKKFYINPRNSKFLEVYDDNSKNSLYELKLSSMPLKIVVSKKSNVALVSYWSGKTIEIIDLIDERVISTIPIDANATDVVLNEKDNLAYVASQNAKAIYVINLNTMQMSSLIKLDQNPNKITYNSIDNSITFYDDFSSKVYNVTKSAGEYVVQPIGTVANASGVVADVANVYVTSRTDSKLYVFDKVLAKQIDVIDIDKKPTDMIIYGTKIYILCSKEGYLDVYDSVENKLISREQISKDGFYSKMTLIPEDKNILITGINASSYLLYNLEKMEIVEKQDSYIDVANIIILEKAQKL